MKTITGLLSTVTLFCFCCIASAQTTVALDQKPGLGSPYFVKVDTVFHFPTGLNVQGKIYYKEFAQRYKAKEEGKEIFFPVQNILLACDTFVLGMSKEMGDSIHGGLSAINIFAGSRWHTMYGETQIFGDSTEIKELGGSGIKDGFYYVYFCPTEQPCFSFRVKVSESEKLLAGIKELYALYNQVGAGRYNKLP